MPEINKSEKSAAISATLMALDERTSAAVLDLVRRAEKALTGSVTVHMQKGIALKNDTHDHINFEKEKRN